MSFKIRTPWRAGMVLCTSLAAAPALAQDAQTLYLRSLAATCANCHGTDGRAVEGFAMPTLAGREASYIVEQMNAFKSGARPSTIMQQLAKGYSDAQIGQIAAWFAAQKK